MIVFDTETTGFAKADATPLDQQPQIIEFAAIKLDDDTLEEKGRIEFLAHPGRKLPPEIITITGITDEMLNGHPPFGANVKLVSDFFLGERKLVAHNIDFDRKLLSYELMRLGMMHKFPWPPEHICTIEASYSIQGRKLKAGVLHELATGAPHADAHRAMSDTAALVTCIRWLRTFNRI